MGSSLWRTGKEQETNENNLKVIHYGITCRHTSLSADICMGQICPFIVWEAWQRQDSLGNCRVVRTGNEHTRLCCWVIESLLLVPAGAVILFWETGMRTLKTVVLRTGVNGKVQEESVQAWPGPGYHCTTLKAAKLQETLCALHICLAQRHQMRLGFWGKWEWLVWQWA